MRHGVVIVGGSIAGYNVATTLRKEGYKFPITIINQQDSLPYDVSKLSKSWMLDVENESPPLFKNAKYFSDHQIKVQLNTIIKEIKPDENKILTDKKEEIYYDTLVLATGSTLRTLDISGSDAKGVFYLRNIENALKIKKWSKNVQDVVIVGAGFIGLELASALTQLGLKVNVIEFENYPLGRVVGEEVSKYFTNMHKSHGVSFYLGEGIESFEKDENGNVAAALTSKGNKISCQMAIIGIGVTPNTSLTNPGLKEDHGYLVNEYGETSLPNVYAVGDCTIWPYQGKMVHVEHWEHAYNHGQVIAKNIIQSKSVPYTVRPYFWTDHYDQTFEYLGHTKAWDKTYIRGSLDTPQFAVAYVDEANKPLAILSANNTIKRKQIEKFMDKNEPINENDFEDFDKHL